MTHEEAKLITEKYNQFRLTNSLALTRQELTDKLYKMGFKSLCMIFPEMLKRNLIIKQGKYFVLPKEAVHFIIIKDMYEATYKRYGKKKEHKQEVSPLNVVKNQIESLTILEVKELKSFIDNLFIV